MEFKQEANRVYAEDESGKLVAEVTFPFTSDNTVSVNHTFVDSSLRGQGVAALLLETAAQKIRQNGCKVIPTCSYAVKWFERHPEFNDIL